MENIWDVICIGAGSAGLPLAIQVAKRNGRILHIEADNRIGGTLHWSTGQVAAAQTKLQKRMGIQDSPDEHYEDAQRIGKGKIDPTILRLFVDNAAATLDWLEDLGFCPAPNMPVAGENHEAYRTRRYLWGEKGGISFLEILKPIYEKFLNEGKITLKTQTKFTELILNNSGEVTGVKVINKDGSQENFSSKNIVLTTGGYASNKDEWELNTPQYPFYSHCNPFSQGDGLRAARSIGADTGGGENFLCTFSGWLERPQDPLSIEFLMLSPKDRNIWEIFVDSNGKRFMQEDHPSIEYREHALMKQPEMRMNIIFDDKIIQNATPISLLDFDKYKSKFGNHDNFVKADTIEQLAEKINVPFENLLSTIENYNLAVENQIDHEWNKFFLIRKIEIPPFYAIKSNGFTIVSPEGLKVNDRLNVINKHGKSIKNLYAAGEILGFGNTSGHGFVGGMSLTPAMTFGKILGENILQW